MYDTSWEEKAKRELANHPITATLRAQGLTDEELYGVRFRKHLPSDRFENWPITWPHHLDIYKNPQLLSMLCDFAALRYALIDGPKTEGADVCLAWECVGEALNRREIVPRSIEKAQSLGCCD